MWNQHQWAARSIAVFLALAASPPVARAEAPSLDFPSPIRHHPPQKHEGGKPRSPSPSKTTAVAPPKRLPRAAGGGLKLSGYVQNETAGRLKRPQNFIKFRNTALLGAAGNLGPSLSYKISGRIFYDAIYDLQSRYPTAVRNDFRFETALREAYLDASAGGWDMRIGRQTVVWGEAVGFFVADVVNARDLREFLLPDFDFIRIPQWAFQTEKTFGALHAELVWIPFLEFNRYPAQGSEFATVLPTVAGQPLQLVGGQNPPNRLANGELGGRLSTLAGGWDMSLFHYYGWDKSLVLSREGSPSPTTVFPIHKRLPQTGATFSKEIHGAVLKGETVYYSGEYFSSIDPTVATGTVRRDALDILLSVDESPWRKFDLTAQFLQRRVFNYGPALFHQGNPTRNYASLWLKTGFLDNRLEPELLLVSNLRQKDRMLRPKIRYSWGGCWRLTLGADFFDGASTEPFGEFSARNRAYTELRYSF